MAGPGAAMTLCQADQGEGGLRIERRFHAGDLEIRAVLTAIRGELAGAGLDDEALGTVELVLAEVLNNIAEHSYGAGGGPVALRLWAGSGAVLCEIGDQGLPMPAGQVPQPGLPPIAPPAPLPEGGFGWHIVRCLVNAVDYERTAGGNVLRLRIPVAG